MNVMKITEDIAEQYHGSGHALAAVTGGRVIKLIYLSDVLPDLDEEDPGAVRAALGDPRIGPSVRLLQSLGEVSVGMCSCWEFCEL